MRKQTLLATATMLLASTAHSSELLFEGGLGILNTEEESIAQVKFAKIGLQNELWHALVQRVNGGGWVDTYGAGRTSSAYAGYQLGFDVKNSLLEAAIFSGPTYITQPDTSLGGHFQFNETIFLGVRNPTTSDVFGVAYEHFSSAGLEMPNQGKDFITLEIKFPF
jgi:hypothetical protein